ncbi:unnamed protein product [Amoebophrya sp. A25]|nr:unnamed protein product [Amoebophrya sp. A25]|eukprot:GSA25T00025852001.1
MSHPKDGKRPRGFNSPLGGRSLLLLVGINCHAYARSFLHGDHVQENALPSPSLETAEQNVKHLLPQIAVKALADDNRSSSKRATAEGRDLLNHLLEETLQAADKKVVSCDSLLRTQPPLVEQLEGERDAAIRELNQVSQQHQEIVMKMNDVSTEMATLTERLDAEKSAFHTRQTELTADLEAKKNDAEKVAKVVALANCDTGGALATQEVNLRLRSADYGLVGDNQVSRGAGNVPRLDRGAVVDSLGRGLVAAAAAKNTTLHHGDSTMIQELHQELRNKPNRLRCGDAEEEQCRKRRKTSSQVVRHVVLLSSSSSSMDALSESTRARLLDPADGADLASESCPCPEVLHTDCAGLSEKAAFLFGMSHESISLAEQERQRVEQAHAARVLNMQEALKTETAKKQTLGSELVAVTKTLHEAQGLKNALSEQAGAARAELTELEASCKRELHDLLNTRLCSLRVIRNALHAKSAESGQPIADCELSEWTQGSCEKTVMNKTSIISCDDSAKGGFTTWSREITQEPNAFGHKCGMLETKTACGQHKCPQDCELAPWEDWSACTVTCGMGTQARSRAVLKPAKYGGEVCLNVGETRACEGIEGAACNKECQLEPLWTPWSGCVLPCNDRLGGAASNNFALRRRNVAAPAIGEGMCPAVLDSERFETVSCELPPQGESEMLAVPEITVPPQCPSGIQCMGQQDILFAFDMSAGGLFSSAQSKTDSATNLEALQGFLRRFVLKRFVSSEQLKMERLAALSKAAAAKAAETGTSVADAATAPPPDAAAPAPAFLSSSSKAFLQRAQKAVSSQPGSSTEADEYGSFNQTIGFIVYGNGQIDSAEMKPTKANLAMPLGPINTAMLKKTLKTGLTLQNPGYPNAAQAMAMAESEFEQNRRPEAQQVLVLVTDGHSPAVFREQAVAAAKKLKATGVRIMVLLLSPGEGESGSTASAAAYAEESSPTSASSSSACNGGVFQEWASFPPSLNIIRIPGGIAKLQPRPAGQREYWLNHLALRLCTERKFPGDGDAATVPVAPDTGDEEEAVADEELEGESSDGTGEDAGAPAEETAAATPFSAVVSPADKVAELEAAEMAARGAAKILREAAAAARNEV